MNSQDLDLAKERIVIDLVPGTAWAIYSDNGPQGPCGQCMRITCPHAIFMTWPTEDAMREELKSFEFRNKKHTLMMGVVGEWTAGGVLKIYQGNPSGTAG